MSFPSSTGTVQDNLAQAWHLARSVASALKQRANALRTAAAAGTVGSSAILDFATYLAEAKLMFNKAAALPGIAAYARAQIDDPTLDIVAEFQAMVAKLDDTTAWVTANFPKDGSGFLLARQFQAGNTGRTTDRQFSIAQTATLRLALDALIAAID